jgi:ABC-type nitrate/sulfonate/bicarbonate transport system ATPase subunit
MLDARIAAKRLPSGEMLLREMALTAAPGEIVALLGASGTGKTSTLRILLGLDSNFEGTVRHAAMRIGAVFQEPRLLPWCTVGDNIRLVIPRGQPMPNIAALLREVGLAGSEALYPRQISLGMARRAALVRALAIAPDLLILDEPFVSLDANAAGLIAARLARVRDESRAALVIATHDIDRAMALATRIVVLAGRPATVAYQADIAADANEAVRAELIRRFPFVSEQKVCGGGLSDPPAKG